MARQLEAAGDAVDRLVFVDGEPPGADRPRHHPVMYPLQRLVHYFKDGRLSDALAWSSRVAFESIAVRRFGRGQARRRAELRAEHARAHSVYRGGSVATDAVVIRSREWALQPDNDWQLDWDALVTGRIRTATVSGTHAGLVEVENSDELADRIRWALDDTFSCPPVDPAEADPLPSDPASLDSAAAVFVE